MNLFSKNPFASKNSNTRIVGNNVTFDEKQKLENIKENMAKLKFQNSDLGKNDLEENVKSESSNDLKSRIDFMRNINK